MRHLCRRLLLLLPPPLLLQLPPPPQPPSPPPRVEMSVRVYSSKQAYNKVRLYIYLPLLLWACFRLELRLSVCIMIKQQTLCLRAAWCTGSGIFHPSQYTPPVSAMQLHARTLMPNKDSVTRTRTCVT